jgi:murein DD-endopeptidase MepM/ murein hydrolase activator NlpD
MTFSFPSTILQILLVLMVCACSEPVTYAPVKEVNQALTPDNGYVPHELPHLATDNQGKQQPSSSINPQTPKSNKQSEMSKDGFYADRPKKLPTDIATGQRVPKKQVDGLKPSADNDVSIKNADKPRITLQNKTENTSGHTLGMKKTTVIAAAKPQNAVILPPKGNGKINKNPLKSNANINYVKNYSGKDTKKLDNLELTEKNSKKSIISIDNKKLLKLNFQWPLQGRLTRSFSQTGNKGIEIVGKSGQTVVASEAGKAVYCGHGLAGLGNVAIIKHDENYLSAYANNSKLIVKEGQFVNKGQAIGQLGKTGLRKTSLHFEIRKNGKPVNPLALLPKN